MVRSSPSSRVSRCRKGLSRRSSSSKVSASSNVSSLKSLDRKTSLQLRDTSCSVNKATILQPGFRGVSRICGQAFVSASTFYREVSVRHSADFCHRFGGVSDFSARPGYHGSTDERSFIPELAALGALNRPWPGILAVTSGHLGANPFRCAWSVL